ncbi:MAG: glycosyltransferase family 39 protein [Candidatus Daviesbacteria bacterium]|nr:glycosyltransferase family 39 protein [Candidatus Daviesbacteria bacterium]
MKDLTFRSYILILCLVGAVIYFHSLTNQFLLDDPSQISNNPAVHSLTNIPQLFLGSTFAGGKNLEGIYYKPVMTTFYTVIYSLFGANPFPFHLIQLILHALNAILVFLLLKKFFSSNLSFLLSLIFLVHPMNSENVLYISNLQDALFMFFGLLSLNQITKDKLKLKDYLLFTLFICLSLLSKETGLLFLIVGSAYRIIFQRGKSFLYISGGILVSYLLIHYLAVGAPVSTDTPFPIMRLSLLERLLNVPAIVFYYLKTFAFPADLAVGQQWVVRNLTFENFYLPLILNSAFFLGLLGLLTRLKGEKFKKFLFFLIWLVIGLGLHLQIMPLDATVADRWIYFPMIGLLGMVSILLLVILNLIQDPYRFRIKSGMTIMVIIIIVIFSVRSFNRASDWKDGLTLASHDTKVTTDSFVMENNLGFELINAERYPEAQLAIEKSTSLAPYWWLNWNNLGVVYRHEGKMDQAEEAFRKSTENTDTFFMPYENLAELLLYFKDPKEAETFIVQASNKLGMSEKLWFILSITEFKLENMDNALKAAQQALALNPNNQTYQQLVQALQTNQKIIVEPPKY